MKTQLLKVAMFARLEQLYSYLPPIGVAGERGGDTEESWVGRRVLVPLGSRRLVGIVVAVDAATCAMQEDGTPLLNLEGGDSDAKTVVALKNILKPLDDRAIFNAQDMRLAEWMHKFYLHPLGETFMQMLPASLRKDGASIKWQDTQNSAVERPQLSVCLPDFALSDGQAKTLSYLYEKLDHYACYLLYGHTNSGKTEVYLRLTEAVLRKGRQVLILVPEISLTPQTIKRFKERFPASNLVIFHSKLTSKQRLEAWQHCFDDWAKIVIGTRSAIFLPLRRLGIIIMDEEHDASFKQESQLRYSAREVALVKAKFNDLPVVLGSATPSVESWYNALREQYHLLTLPPRDDSQLVDLQIVDANREGRVIKGFSSAVLSAIEQRLMRKEQVLIFLNRRGFAATVICPKCGWQASCPHCDNRLTLHKEQKRLICHYCEYNAPIFGECPSCHHKQLKIKGLGTEGIEEALGEIFPAYPIARIDRDTTSRKGALDRMLEGINRKDYQILLGTQILAKGHHFPGVTLVVIMNVDAGLFSGDFHHEEQLAQLVVQVMGRAGRGDLPGKVMLQTSYPEHPIFKELKQQDYTVFLQRCLAERQEAGLPPFSCHAVLQAEAKRRPAVWQFLQNVARVARDELATGQVQIWGPAALTMERRADHFRAQLVFQAPNYAKLHYALRRIDAYIHAQNIRFKWFWDINPLNLLSA